MRDQILTVKEAASLLKLAEKTVCPMAQRGELPAFKVRGQWRIRHVDFDTWAEHQDERARSGPEGDR